MSSYKKAKTDEYEYTGKKTRCQSILSAIYNDKKGSIFGRTPKSWALIIIFYLIFYSCLSGFFLGMISVFMYGFVPKIQPMRTGKNSILTFTPGVNANPRSSNESALVMASSNNGSKHYNKYIEFSEAFFKKSFVDQKDSKGVQCNETANDEPKDVSKFCIFTKAMLGPCSDPKKELDSKRLCVFVRVNRIYGWLPEIENKSISNDVWLDCEGQNPGDINNLGSPEYYPSIKVQNKNYGKFPNMFFPYIMQPSYISPMVALQFPNMSKNLVNLVQCSLKNIKNFYKPIRFEIMLLEN